MGSNTLVEQASALERWNDFRLPALLSASPSMQEVECYTLPSVISILGHDGLHTMLDIMVEYYVYHSFIILSSIALTKGIACALTFTVIFIKEFWDESM